MGAMHRHSNFNSAKLNERTTSEVGISNGVVSVRGEATVDWKADADHEARARAA